jgi:hypothetical protein
MCHGKASPTQSQAGSPSEGTVSDRRDSPRVSVKLWIRQVEVGEAFEEREGNVGVWGAYFESTSAPIGKVVELKFALPGLDEEFLCNGEILSISEQRDKFGAHVRFVDLSTEVELTIAKFIDDNALGDKGSHGSSEEAL